MLHPSAHGDPSVPAGSRWFVVETLPRRETVALNHLVHQGFTSYLPQRLRTIRHARQLRTERRPLFPGYLFVQLDLGRHQWRSVSTAHGVRQLVTAAGLPLPIRPGVVESLIKSSDDDGLVHFCSDAKRGGRVRLLAGPFAAELGVLESLDHKQRVQLLLTMMNREVRVHMGRQEIVPV